MNDVSLSSSWPASRSAGTGRIDSVTLASGTLSLDGQTVGTKLYSSR